MDRPQKTTVPTARILLLADTHLGFDLPSRPRIIRRRRGHDFFANYERALRPALRGEVDLVVHGGDLLYRSRVPASLVRQAMEPLFRVADAGVPVFIVPGNHERSRIPYPLLARHRNVFVFDRPRTFATEVAGVRLALAGFPYDPDVGRRGLGHILRETEWRFHDVDARVLCFHQLVQGSRVSGYTFTRGPDIIPTAALPPGFAAFFTGHVHRQQVLTTGPSGRPLRAPVLYPGSIERTSFAERDERKGYILAKVALGPPDGGRLVSWRFAQLPARPMVDLPFELSSKKHDDRELRRALSRLPNDAVVRIHVRRDPRKHADLPAARLREIAPPTMNVSVVFQGERVGGKLNVDVTSSGDPGRIGLHDGRGQGAGRC